MEARLRDTVHRELYDVQCFCQNPKSILVRGVQKKKDVRGDESLWTKLRSNGTYMSCCFEISLEMSVCPSTQMVKFLDSCL